MGLKEKYNGLLERFERAEKYFEKADIDEQLKHYKHYCNLLGEIVDCERKLTEEGVEITKKIREGGFDV